MYVHKNLSLCYFKLWNALIGMGEKGEESPQEEAEIFMWHSWALLCVVYALMGEVEESTILCIPRTPLYPDSVNSHFSQGHLHVRLLGAYILSWSISVCFGKQRKSAVVEYFSSGRISTSRV